MWTLVLPSPFVANTLEFFFISATYQEKRLRVNMGLKKLQEKVKQQQEKVGEKVSIYLCIDLVLYIKKLYI